MRMKISAAAVLFLLVSQAVWGVTVYLPKTVYTSTPFISLASLCQTSLGSNYIIPVNNSKVFSNKDLCQMFIQAGIKDFTLIGGGVELKYYPYLSTVKDITDGLLAYYPNALPSIKPESLPSKYFILSSDYSMYGNNILASLNCIDFSKGAGVPKTLLLTFSSKPQLPAAVPDNPNIPDIYPLSSVPQGIAAEEEVYISKIQDYKAYLVYQAGGLSITVEARIIKKLDDTTYLVENVNSGKMLMAKTLK